ncbi:MAG: recombinase RecA [Candidatus Edwardsbacteria bacterium]|nr:recombinase RecA [Candidatus Edwardsbacteria bacterium]MBU1577555.1 recombinase RecA [Candidatus Edwardsbacteria bacterium]MBU2462507.1 recombinase RecA [Candidatus Edwardsbacteria bacterium]MBU2593650.1 recombinase RecA [Candidatus Edwardsbacteria bacterium]
MAEGEKAKALDLAVSQIEKQFGKGAIMKWGSRDAGVNVEVISTGSISLDYALGVGGVPRGRVVEIYGPEASGKTTLALSIVAQAQKNGGTAAYIDAEHALDSKYARAMGVDVDNLLISQPDTGEDALEITETLVRSNAMDVIVIDSVAALVPKAEIEGDMGDSHMGLQARLMSQALRKLTAVANRSKTCIVFINQIRMKIGVMFGNPETTPGGLALKFHSSVRMDIRRIETIKQGDQMIGNRVRVKVVKNKMAPPFRNTEFEIIFGEGISYAGDLMDLAVENNVIEKAGAWFSYQGERLGQGRDNIKTMLKQNPDLLQKIEIELKAKLNQPAGQKTEDKDPEKEEKEEPKKRGRK